MGVNDDEVDWNDSRHEWLSFVDGDGDRWMFDVTFLTSRWTCIFGQGCLGVHDEPTPELSHGCCSHGAHFQDDDDRRRTERFIARLTDDQWQFKSKAKRSGAIKVARNGDVTTRVVDGACIFLNRPGFPGGAGCALHRAALEAGERPLDWKPNVCWQLPLRLDTATDDHGRSSYVLRQWDRADWGEGGEEFHWWCTEDSLAFVDKRPVYVTLRDEIVEMIGLETYQWLVEQLEARSLRTYLPHPALRRKAPSA